jgi:hypothetical protein
MQLFILALFELFGQPKGIRNVEVDDAKVGLRTHVPGLEARVLSRSWIRQTRSVELNCGMLGGGRWARNRRVSR